MVTCCYGCDTMLSPPFHPQVLGNVSEFHRAVKLVIDNVSFDKDSTVQVFEANIRFLISYCF